MEHVFLASASKADLEQALFSTPTEPKAIVILPYEKANLLTAQIINIQDIQKLNAKPLGNILPNVPVFSFGVESLPENMTLKLSFLPFVIGNNNHHGTPPSPCPENYFFRVERISKSEGG